MRPFGGLGGLGGVPMRSSMPNSQVVEANPFADWGNPQAWQQDWQQRYDAEMLKPVAPVYQRPVWETTRLNLVPGTPGYDASAASPSHEQIQATQNSAWNPNNDRARQAAMDFARERGMTLWQGADGSMVIGRDAYSPINNAASRGASHLVGPIERRRIGTEQYTPEGDWRNLQPLYQERDRLLPKAEPMIRQQQAYDWMEGGQQQNARMSPDYTNPGFGQISGMPNPFAPSMGAAANMGQGNQFAANGINMDWADGIYDPQSSQQPGVFAPGQNARRGW